jgi:hypothetical protein
MSEAQYEESVKRLEAAGLGAPKGRDYHVCFKVDGKIHVSDIWNSKEEFEEFGKTLMPILQEIGADVGQPVFLEVHNTIKG